MPSFKYIPIMDCDRIPTGCQDPEGKSRRYIFLCPLLKLFAGNFIFVEGMEKAPAIASAL